MKEGSQFLEKTWGLTRISQDWDSEENTGTIVETEDKGR